MLFVCICMYNCITFVAFGGISVIRVDNGNSISFELAIGELAISTNRIHFLISARSRTDLIDLTKKAIISHRSHGVLDIR